MRMRAIVWKNFKRLAVAKLGPEERKRNPEMAGKRNDRDEKTKAAQI
jgi:hypothetical protein